MLVQQIQKVLTEDVCNKLHYSIELKWSNNLGSIHIYTKKDKLFEKVLELSTNYTNYWKKTYNVDKIIIKEIKNKNPHIKIKFNKMFTYYEEIQYLFKLEGMSTQIIEE